MGRRAHSTHVLAVLLLGFLGKKTLPMSVYRLVLGDDFGDTGVAPFVVVSVHVDVVGTPPVLGDEVGTLIVIT